MQIHDTRPVVVKNFVCSICGNSFAEEISLDRHAKRHTDEEKLVCTLCGKLFYSKSNLNRHGKHCTGKKVSSCMTTGQISEMNCSDETCIEKEIEKELPGDALVDVHSLNFDETFQPRNDLEMQKEEERFGGGGTDVISRNDNTGIQPKEDDVLCTRFMRYS